MGRHHMYVPQGRRAVVLPTTLVTSLLAHLLGLAYVMGLGRLPDAGLEWQTPVEVEWSLTDLPLNDEPGHPRPATAAPPPAAPEPAPAGAADGAANRVAANEKAPRVADAGVPEPAKPARRRPRARIKPMPRAMGDLVDAGVAQDTSPSIPETPLPALSANDGAMASLRVDMATLRGSPYAGSVRDLIARLDDAQALLSGSGVDPIADLDRLWLASPDLSRDRSVMAGTLQGQAEDALAAARALAARNGQAPPTVRIEAGVQVVPWPTDDATPRVLALLDEHTFTIARRDDLPRVLELMGGARRAGAPPRMLKLDPNQLAQFDLIGAPHFVRSTAGLAIPRLVHARVRMADAAQLTISADVLFANEQEANQMLEHLRLLQQRYGNHPLVQLAGLSKAIRGARLARADLGLSLELRLQPGEAQSLLAALADSISVDPSPALAP